MRDAVLIGLSVCFVVGYLAFVGLGCTSARTEKLGAIDYPPRPESSVVEVYDAAADVERPFEKIGRITAKGGTYASWEAVQEELKREARAIGADAVILGNETSEVEFDRSGGMHDLKAKTALAIRYLERQPDAAPTGAPTERN